MIHAIGAPEAMPPAKRNARCHGPAYPARRDRRARAFPRSRLSAQGRLRQRHRGGGVRRRHHRVRHAEHAADHRHAGGARRQARRSPAQRPMSITASMPCSAKTPSNTCPALVEGGIIGFKLYMGNTFGRIPSPSTGAMLEAFEVVAPTGKRISLHAETNSIMERRETRLRAAGRTEPLAHLAARPAVVAVEAVARAAILAEWTGARIHILHISSAAELRPLRRSQGARRRHHRRDLPALSAAVGRPTTRNSAASSGSIRRCAKRRTSSRSGMR